MTLPLCDSGYCVVAFTPTRTPARAAPDVWYTCNGCLSWAPKLPRTVVLGCGGIVLVEVWYNGEGRSIWRPRIGRHNRGCRPRLDGIGVRWSHQAGQRILAAANKTGSQRCSWPANITGARCGVLRRVSTVAE